MKEDYWPHDTTLWVKDFHGNNPKFVYYFFKSLDVKNLDVGSANPTLNRNHVHPIEILWPPLEEQNTIANLLSTLDDKIELNHQMDKTLESIASTIFKSWFIDFDPVRAKMEGRQPFGMDAETADLFPNSLDETELGQSPSGWEVKMLTDVISLYDSRRVPLSSLERAQRHGTYPYYGAASIIDYVDDFLFDGVYVLMGEDGSVIDDLDNPFIQYVWGKFWANNHAHVIQGKGGVSTEHIMLFLKQVNLRPYVTGAVQPKLSQSNMARIPFLLAPILICEKFDRILSDVFRMYRANRDQVLTLITIRDKFLTKLLSGEIRVKDAENLVEAHL